MEQIAQIQFLKIRKNIQYEKTIYEVLKKCFEIEKITNPLLCVSIILTNNENIKIFNKKYRNIDKHTDVLSFPAYEKGLLKNILKKQSKHEVILGDIVISLEQIKRQSLEYNHPLKRELGYMIVHSFYHLLGYDHMTEQDKQEMRKKEEIVLKALNIRR